MTGKHFLLKGKIFIIRGNHIPICREFLYTNALCIGKDVVENSRLEEYGV